MTPFSVRHSLNGNPEPHEVVLRPEELRPFGVRFLFRLFEDDAGDRCVVMVGTPHLLELPSTPELAYVTPELQRTLEENWRRYRRIAEKYFDMEIVGGNEERSAMLQAERKSGRRLTRPYLVDLANEYQTRMADGRHRRDRFDDVLADLAAARNCSVRTVQRHLDRAEAEGLLPSGIRPRRAPTVVADQ
jgi:hypothetical protein